MINIYWCFQHSSWMFILFERRIEQCHGDLISENKNKRNIKLLHEHSFLILPEHLVVQRLMFLVHMLSLCVTLHSMSLLYIHLLILSLQSFRLAPDSYLDLVWHYKIQSKTVWALLNQCFVIQTKVAKSWLTWTTSMHWEGLPLCCRLGETEC